MTQKTKEIEELNQRLLELKNQREAMLAEARETADKRDQINEQHRKLRAEIGELKTARNKLNEEVQELKIQRSALNERTHGKIDEIKELRLEARAFVEKRPPRSHQSLQEEIECIDWRIQTEPLGKQEEKQLVERVKELETQLKVYKKHEQLIQRTNGLQAEIEEMNAKGDVFHEKLTATAQKSQDTHQRMVSKIEESKALKTEADNLHQTFLQARERTKPIQEEIAKILDQLKLLKGEIHSEKEQERKKKEETLREKLEAEAREKVKRGDKLTLAEFKLIAGNDEETAQES
jgi:uncharacterized coiled-coil DUF342 family protein